MKFSGINLLDELQRAELDDLRNVFNSRQVKKGAIIFSPDQEEDLVFIVETGKVRMLMLLLPVILAVLSQAVPQGILTMAET